jgi:NTE family protein
LPGGLNPGHPIGLLLDRLTLPYGALDDFDALPIPFRCVATDMLAGEPVVLKDGSLSLALRATMALPGVFTPVERDGKTLADGGLVNNLPTDVVRDMGAKIIIAVDVGTPLGGPESLRSFTGMFNQAVRVMNVQNVRRNLPLASVVLTPEISRAMGAEYQAGETIARLGYQSAAARGEELQQLAIGDVEWQQLLAQRQARRRQEGPAPAVLEVRGAVGADERSIREYLGKSTRRPPAMKGLEEGLTAITGWGRYDALGYERLQRDGRDGLRIRAHPKPYGPPFVNLGLESSVAKGEEAEVTFGSRVTVPGLAGYGSELRTDISVGSRPRLAVEYYRPLGAHGWFLAPHLFTSRSTENLFRNGSRVAGYRRDEEGIGLDLGYGLGRGGELRLGYAVRHVNAWARIGDPLLPAVSGGTQVAALRWAYNGQDSAVVPMRGVRASAAAEWFFGSPGVRNRFPRAELSLTAFRPVSRRRSLFATAAGGTTFGSDAPWQEQFTLGGPLRLGGYSRAEFRGNHYLYFSVGYLRQLGTLPALLGGKLYAGNWLETGRAFDRSDAARFSSNLSGGFIAETRLGPMFLGSSLGQGGRRKLYFSLGRGF